MEGEGMVAVVRGLKDAGLAVTVVDGERRYTLIPNAETRHQVGTGVSDAVNYHCNSSAQAVDGRYTSTYQAAHCNMNPTSPMVHVDEFPPQRPKGHSPGHGNFVVGGAGSGEAYIPVKKSSIGRCPVAPEKGRACSPHNSSAYTFVSSLRKYPPNLSPDRSTEMVERLINYSPVKHLSRAHQRTSPIRVIDDSYTRDPIPKYPSKSGRESPGEPDFSTRVRKVERFSKEKRMESAGIPHGDYRIPQEYEIRFLKDLPPRRVPNRFRAAADRMSDFHASPAIKNEHKHYNLPNTFINSVDTESQAAVKMVSREVSTAATPAPSRRTIAVPLTPSPSTAKAEGECSCVKTSYSILYNNSETALGPLNRLNSRKSVQTVCSSLEFKYNRSTIGDNRRSRSHDDLRVTEDDFRWDALDLLEGLSHGSKTKQNVGVYGKLIDTWLDPDKNEVKSSISEEMSFDYIDCHKNCEKIVNKCNKGNNRVNCVESTSINAEQELECIIKIWLSEIIIQTKDFQGKHFDKNAVLNSATNKIKTLILNKYIADSELKSKIINEMQGIPISSHWNIELHVDKLINIILHQAHNANTQMAAKKTNKISHCLSRHKNNKKAIITESDIKNFVEEMLLDFMNKSNKEISEHRKCCVEKELVDVLKNSIDSIRHGIDSHVRAYVQNTLKKLGQITNQQAYFMTKKLFNNFHDILNDDNFSKSYTVLPVHSNRNNEVINTSKDNDSILPIDEKDVRANLDAYTRHLTEVIDAWLASLNLGQMDERLRQVVVNDLAGEIIDRQNYLELKPSSRGTDADELEQLKFQIFKWLNKLVGDDVTKAISRAQELMDKIGSLPMPMSANPQENIVECDYTPFINEQLDYQPSLHNENCSMDEPERQLSTSRNNRHFSNLANLPPCCVGKNRLSIVETQKNIDEDYDKYVQQWLLEIPIPVTNLEEQKAADLARLSIYSGIWKAITRSKFDPKIYSNSYYYQDILEDEIEELLQMNLPQTKELEHVKDKLKAQLIEKTLTVNEQIKAATAPSCFKQQLLDNLDNYLPKNLELTEDEVIAQNDLVEDYILFTTYKENNDVTGNIHRNNFLRNIDKLADSIKKNHKDEFKQMNYQTYVNELISAVSKVPMPNNDTVKQEACEILVQKEIDHWLTDLPLKSDFNPIEKLNMRNTVASKVNEIGKEMNLSDCNAKKELRKVLPKYLKKLPLNEDANLNFLISELINRLICMPKQVKRKSVSFQIPQNYEEFSRYMPGCSSLLGHSGIPDEGSYMIVGGEIGPEPKNFLSFKQPTVTENEWLSMEQTKPPSGMINWSQRSPRNSEYENTEPEKLSVSYDQPLPYQEPYFTHYPQNPSFIMPNPNTAPGVNMQDTQRPLTPLAIQNSNAAKTQSTSKLHPMARGGMGVLGTSQIAEPSRVRTSYNHAYMQPSKTINNYKVPETFTSTIAKDGKATADSPTNTAADQPQQHEFYLSTDSKGYPIDRLLCRTVNRHRHPEARLTNSAKKFKSSVISNHFTPSSIIVGNKQEENIPTKRKSDEEVVEKLKVKESENIIGCNKEEHLPQAETVIVNMAVDKTKSHLEKLQNLALKLNDPVEENRLKKKIDYFLHKTLNIFDNIDKEATELKWQQLPDRIINRLKTVLLINTHKGKNPKYYSRCIIDKLKATVKDWLNKLNVKKKDEFGTTNDDGILNYVIDKIQPIALNRPKSDSDYKRVLELKVIDIVNSLSLFSENQNSNLIDTLVNEIINIDGKIPIAYIQPTNAEIRQFVKDEIIFISEKSHVEISTAKMQNLEIILSDLLLDLTDVKDLNDYVIYEIARLFENIAELPADQAKFYTNIIINDYKEFYFRLHFFSGRENKIFIPDNSSLLPTKNNSASSNERNLERYINELINEIEKWFTKLNIQINEKNFQEIVTKNLACDIVDRYKYLEKNPNSKGTVLEELEHLKYQIFKRTSKIIGENALEHAEELMKSIHLLIVPQTFNVANPINESSSKRSSEIHDPFIEFLSDLIYEWFHQLPLDAHSLEDTSFNRRLIKSLAEDIKETVDNSKLYNIDKNIDEWIVKMFNRKLSGNYIQQLKNKIFPYVEESVKIMKDGPEQENVVKSYKVIIDKWVDNISLKDEVFVTNKSELVNKLAKKLYTSVNRLSEPLSLNDCNLLREDILDWLKILPLDEHLSDKCMNKYIDMLIANIKNHHLEDTSPIKLRQTDDSLLLGRLEAAMHDCITKLPDNISEAKDNQESVKFNDFVLHHSTHDESLEASVEVWLNKLPIRVTDFVYFRIKKKTFIENLKLLRTLGANDKIIINEIIKFMKTLPMEITRHQGNIHLQEKSLTLIKDYFYAKPYDDTAKSVENVIKNWAKPLSMKSTYDPKALISLIDKVSLLICDLINHPRLDLDEKHNKVIREEIISFLEKITFKGFSEQIVSQMADCLTKNLKDIMKRKTQADVIVNDNSEIKTINKHTIRTNLDAYAAEIAKQVNNWLNKFNFIQKDNKEFNTLIDNLVEDIIEREKHLKRSPQCQRRPKSETEQLKCLIYKRVNKLLDCQKLDTASHIDDLIKHVQSITVGMFTKNPQVYMQSQSVNLKKISTSTPDQFQENGPSNYSSSESPAVIDRSQSVTVLNKNPKETIFEKYENIFKKKVYDLPIETPTPEGIQLSELARTGIYNGIMKTFFSLKSDQELENDYGYFELILEDKLDDMLDLLPQTEEMQKMRHGWKVSILSNAMDMLKEMQEVSDRPSFKQRLKDGFNRKFAKNFELEQCFLLQQGFLAEMAEAYILETKYKEDDPLKANIYRQRLMKKVDEMANHLTRLHNIEFRFLQKPQLIQHAMKILAEVPLPNEDILNEEVEEILLAEEIEQWYKELPVSPYINDFDQVFRKRMMNILAQKLHEIDKNNDELNESKEEQMKHEISKFLTERARLEHDKDLNINFMVDELNNRLKQRRLKDLTTYDAFEKKKPISSSLAKLDNTEILAPLIDAYTDTDNIYRNQEYPPSDQYLQFRYGVIDPAQVVSNQSNIISNYGPQHHMMGARQLSDQKSSHYSNGIPYQWPAAQPPDIQTSEIPRYNTNYDLARQNPRNMMQSGVPIQINGHPPSLSTSNFTRNNLGSNIQPEQGRLRQSTFQETDPFANESNPNQYQPRTMQRTYARGSKSLSPNYMPEQGQGTNKPRPDSPEIRSKRNGASPNNVKLRLDSECVCSKQSKPRKKCPLSPLIGNAQKPGRNRRLTIDDTRPFDNNLEQIQGACMRPVRTKYSPDCIRKEMPCEGFYQGSRRRITSLEQEEIVEDKSKAILKCKCNKPRHLCLDSRPCNCRLYTPCYD